ncbi:MAG TPA: hypothetical protein VHA10_12475 [Hypericibacter adhaerens]|uniref:glycoside hydrolase family 19 protein n=1 Tax=Hypericibacter adhaerens TaxID=2602016 RepID=UPI002CAABE09|nr:hypothetical protein [Hypericibacter adhaerens]HWA44020.1 hypothetical protein [Hypericibacter adhaerens]
METTAGALSSGQVLSALLLCGLMGLLGQGVRATIGLKNAKALGTGTPNAQATFSAAYFLLSLMIGFIAGILAGIAIGLGKFTGVDPTNLDLLLGVAASGYVGADFIENSLSIVIPAQPAAVPAGGAAPVSPPVPAPSASPAPPATPPGSLAAMPLVMAPSTPAVGEADLTSALNIVAPKVNTATWVPALMQAFSKFDINSNRRAAAAIGQFLVEAGSAFQEVVENLNYTHAERLVQVFPKHFASVADAEPFVGHPEALANRVYAGRLGNGNEASGDGFRFRGRGLIQLTGRTEYADFGATIGKSAEEAAAYCETPEGAAVSGCWYLSANGCLPLADTWQISAITKRVNGTAMLGNAQRIAYSEAMLKHLGG